MANDGNLTCFDLLLIEQTLNQTWTEDNSFSATRNVVKDDTIQALIQNTTANFEVLRNETTKEFPGVKVEWIEDCPIVTQACDVDCAAPTAGVEIGANCENVAIDQCVMAREISISDNNLRTTSVAFEEVVARGMYRVDQAIAESLNVTAINLIDAAVDENLNPDTLGGLVVPAAVAGNCTTMDPSIWANPVQYFATTAELNSFTTPYFLSGGQSSFFQTVSNANLKAGTGPVVSGLTSWNNWPVYFDIRALDQTLTPDIKTFMINRGEFAVLNAYAYPLLSEAEFRPGKGGEYIAYRMRSPILSEFFNGDWYHDVVYTRACEATSNILETLHTWEILTRFKIAQSPDDCEGNNRVLCFTCT